MKKLSIINQSFNLTITANVILNSSFACESKILVGSVNGNDFQTFEIKDGSQESQNKQLKTIFKKLKVEFNEVSSLSNKNTKYIESAKEEFLEMINLKEPINYIHGRYSTSMFQTT